MAATTRNQAEAQGFSEQDYVSLDKPQDQIEGALDREGQRKEFDKLTGVYPVFCLTENIPNGYLATLLAHKDAGLSAEEILLEVTSADSDSSKLLTQCKLNYLDPNAVKPMPFVGWTIEACYDFFCTHLRSTSLFTYFTFLAIDAACVEATPAEIIVGCDGADFGELPEDAPKLKIIRQPIEEVMGDLCSLETLTRTPRETACRAPFGMSVFPEPMMGPGSVAGARAYKRRALWGLPGPEETMMEIEKSREEEEEEEGEGKMEE